MAKVVEIQGKTVFVRNIPVSTTEESFTSLLSDIGPVKRCFIVKEKGMSIPKLFHLSINVAVTAAYCIIAQSPCVANIDNAII